MKRLLSCLLSLTLLLSLGACTGPPQPTPQPGPIQAADLTIGVLLLGSEEEQSLYNAIHTTMLQEAAAGFELSKDAVHRLYSNPEGAEGQLRALAETGCEVIFATSAAFEEAVLLVAPDYPNIQFCTVFGSKSAADTLPNTHSYYGKVEEARYLAGVLAALKSKTGRLGYVAAMPCAEVISSFSAYYLGAKSVNPDIELFVRYTNSWNNPSLETEAANALVQLDCDVLTHDTDSNAVPIAAQTQAAFAIAYHDEALKSAPKSTLTSVCINWQLYYEYAINAILNGTELAQSFSEGLENEGVYLSDFRESLLPKGAIDRLEEAKSALLDGTTTIFQGPLYDSKGTLVLKEGETYPDAPDALPTWEHSLAGVTVLP